MSAEDRDKLRVPFVGLDCRWALEAGRWGLYGDGDGGEQWPAERVSGRPPGRLERKRSREMRGGPTGRAGQVCGGGRKGQTGEGERRAEEAPLSRDRSSVDDLSLARALALRARSLASLGLGQRRLGVSRFFVKFLGGPRPPRPTR
jgi:hypothetical protein